MFVKTGVFRHSFFMSFLLLCSFQRAFCCGFFPNHFAIPRKVRPRSFTTRSSLFFVMSRPSGKILCKNFCFDLFRLASLLLEKVRPRRKNYAFLAFSSLRLAIRKISSQKPVREFTSLRVRDSLKTNQCSAKCLDFEICSEVSLASCLLRKEVIQPHLPIRLPCYDFTPVIAPTFDGFPPASGVNDFRGVTGGVYKARERIHRSMLTCDY